jgi:hypothetical protein
MRKEVAQTELLELRRTQVRLELQPLLKIMRPDLDARLADFERRLGNWMLPLLGNQDAQRRRFHPQLPGEAPAGKSAAQNRDVIMILARIAHKRDIVDQLSVAALATVISATARR